MDRIVIVGLMCVGGAAGAHDASSMADTLRGRQAALNLSGVAMGAMKSAMDAGQAPTTQGFNSRALSLWAHALPGMFSVGSGTEAGVPTKAKSEIWSERAGFETKAAAQWTVVRQSCQSCHDVYRAD